MNSENLSPGNRVPLSMTRHSWRAAADAPALGEGVEASAEDAGQLAEPPTPEAHAAVPQNTPELASPRQRPPQPARRADRALRTSPPFKTSELRRISNSRATRARKYAYVGHAAPSAPSLCAAWPPPLDHRACCVSRIERRLGTLAVATRQTALPPAHRA
jgi:hypothetical protein